MALGTGMFAGLALIVIVIAGVKIAFSGNIQPWEVVRLVIGIWIPWVMMQFYTTTIPGMSQTFPGMIAEGGNFLHEMLLGDIISSMQTELGDMVRAIAANMQTQAAQGNVIGILTGGVHAFITAVAGSIIMALVGSHAHRLIRCHLCSGDLGSNRPGNPHHSRADLYSVSRVRAAGLSLLGMVQRDAHLFALCRDRRVCVAGVQRRGDCVYHDAGRREPGHPIYDSSGPLDAGRHSAFHCRASLIAQMRGTGFDARHRRRSGRERTHGYGDNGRDGSGQRRSGSGQNSGIRRDQVSQDKTPPAKDAGAEYAEIWGESIHTNRHLRTITVGLGIAVILLDYRGGHPHCLSRSPPAHCGTGG